MRSILDRIRRRLHAEPSCQDVNQFLVEYIDGVLEPDVQARFRAHLERCPRCLPYFEQYRMTLEMMREDGRCDAPEALVEHTLEFLRANIEAN